MRRLHVTPTFSTVETKVTTSVSTKHEEWGAVSREKVEHIVESILRGYAVCHPDDPIDGATLLLKGLSLDDVDLAEAWYAIEDALDVVLDDQVPDADTLTVTGLVDLVYADLKTQGRAL